MNYEVRQKGGESVTVHLVETGEGQYEITVDGRTAHVDAALSGRLIYSVIQDGKQFEAVVDEQGAHGFDVLIAGQLFHLEAVDERTKLLAGSAQAAAAGKQTVEAEMPGKVVKVSAQVGESVTEGQSVLVIEAMKMENDIPSPIEGVITELAVTEGETVESGVTLFVVEPPESEDD